MISCPSFAGTIKGTIVVKTIRSPKDIVVYIKEIQGKEFSPPTEYAIMDQKGLTFIPHVLPILKGTTVDFLNSDTVAHNVFTPSEAGDKFNLGTWQRGVVRNYTFNKLGVVEILCNLHPDMSAYVLVLNNPYFAITQKDGKFLIKDVSAGRYTLNLWHERLKPVTKDVEVPEVGEIEVNFEPRTF